MAGFLKKLWKNRQVEFPNRRDVINSASGDLQTVTIQRNEGYVAQQGDAFNAENMNDLENRIRSGFDTLGNNLAIVLDSPAQIDLVAGEYVLFKDELYVTSSAISTGDIVSVDSNIVRTTIDELVENVARNKQDKITGAASTVVASNLTATRLLQSTSAGKVAASSYNPSILAKINKTFTSDRVVGVASDGTLGHTPYNYSILAKINSDLSGTGNRILYATAAGNIGVLSASYPTSILTKITKALTATRILQADGSGYITSTGYSPSILANVPTAAQKTALAKLAIGSAPAAKWEVFGTSSEKTPYIDFHYNGSTGDYSARIINSANRVLDINANRVNFLGMTGVSALYAGSYNNNSSRKVKTNIKPMTEDEANKLLDVEIVDFDYLEKVGGEKNQHGVIAEDVVDVIPAVVNTGGDILGVDYSKFVPYLIKKIQMLEKEVQELRSKVEEK